MAFPPRPPLHPSLQRAALAAALVVGTLLAGCASEPSIDLEGTPVLVLAAALDGDTSGLANGTVRGTLRLTNVGDADAWTLPSNPCGRGVEVRQEGMWAQEPHELACGRRMAFTDEDLVRIPPGASYERPFGGTFILEPGPATVVVAWMPQVLEDDRFTRPVWDEVLRAELDITVPEA